mmetsp:Transcript_18378/g.26948  ORF Transcript_18378/g.26948 Transcript_18378/m.26948 type:complete len:111 (-) Transcript_18378:35-367(-)
MHRTTFASGYPLVDPGMEHRDAILKLVFVTLLQPPIVTVSCQPQHDLYKQSTSLRALRKVLEVLNWKPFDGSAQPMPDWKQSVEGGKQRMQDAGLAEGDRTLRDIIKFDD